MNSTTNNVVEQQPSALDKNSEAQTKDQIKAKSGYLAKDKEEHTDEKGSKHRHRHHRHKPNLLKQIINKVTHKKEDKGDRLRSVEEPVHQRRIAEPKPLPKTPDEERFEEGMKPSERFEMLNQTPASNDTLEITQKNEMSRTKSEDLTESEETEKRFGRISQRSDSTQKDESVEQPPEEVKRHFSKVLEEVKTSDAKDSLRSYNPPPETKEQFKYVLNEVVMTDTKSILRVTDLPPPKPLIAEEMPIIEEKPSEATKLNFDQVLQDIPNAKNSLSEVKVEPRMNVFIHEEGPPAEIKQQFDLVLQHATSANAKDMLRNVPTSDSDNWHNNKIEENETINLAVVGRVKKPLAMITPDPRHIEAAFQEDLDPVQPPPGDLSTWKEKAAAALLNISATVKETFGYDATEEHLRASEHARNAELQAVRTKGTLNAMEAATLAKAKKLDSQPVAHPYIEPMTKPALVGELRVTEPVAKQRTATH